MLPTEGYGGNMKLTTHTIDITANWSPWRPGPIPSEQRQELDQLLQDVKQHIESQGHKSWIKESEDHSTVYLFGEIPNQQLHFAVSLTWNVADDGRQWWHYSSMYTRNPHDPHPSITGGLGTVADSLEPLKRPLYDQLDHVYPEAGAVETTGKFALYDTGSGKFILEKSNNPKYGTLYYTHSGGGFNPRSQKNDVFTQRYNLKGAKLLLEGELPALVKKANERYSEEEGKFITWKGKPLLVLPSDEDDDTDEDDDDDFDED
jgi:hypothetical protein